MEIKEHIYVSIPRTGTNSIRSVLGKDNDENHRALKTIERKGYSFAFVRHPLDLLVSWYQYHRQHQPQHEQYHQEFCNWVLAGCPHHWDEALLKWKGLTHPLNQWEYVCNDEGVLIANFIGRFELLQMHFNAVCKKINHPIHQLPVLNTSKHSDWETLFTPQARKAAEEQFSKDFEIFNF